MLNLSNIYKHIKPNKIWRSWGMAAQHPQLSWVESAFKAFLEAGSKSLLEAEGRRLYLGCDDNLDQDEWPQELLEILEENGVKAISVDLEAEPRQVVAIDTSSIRLSLSSKGIVIALRGSMVTRSSYGLYIEVFGPFIAYITEENILELLSSMLGGVSSLDYCSKDYQLYNSVQKVLASFLEKRLQEHAAERFRDSILLFDGSLSAGPLDNPIWLVSRILEKARPRGNDVLAFSKTSILRIWGELLTSLKLDARPPYIVDLTWAIERIEMRVKVLGRTYLAKLYDGLGGFRVDASTRRGAEEVFGSLLKSDALIHGYPETLILAHDYCSFTKIDVIAMQSLLKRLGVEFSRSTSIRDLLFNPLDGDYRS